MCTLNSGEVADQGFETLRRSGETIPYIQKICRLASEDTKTEANSLEKLLTPVASWRTHPQLRKIRELRIGRHRAYIEGQNTACEYTIWYVKPHKKEKVDREESQTFQRKMLNAISEGGTRQVALLMATQDDEASESD